MILNKSLGGLALGLLFLFFIYYPSLSGPFIFDDLGNLPLTLFDYHSFNELFEFIKHSARGAMGRQIGILSFVLNNAWLGNTSFDYKIVNLVLHIFNALLFYFIIIKLFKKLSVKNPEINASLIVLLWAFHPLHVSTVLYISQRYALLASFFTLLGFVTYLSLREALIKKNSLKSFILFGTLLLSALLGIKSKENAALLLPFIMLIELFITQNKKIKQIILCTFGMLIIASIALMACSYPKLVTLYQSYTFTPLERLASELVVLFNYMQLTFFPLPSHFIFYYDQLPALNFSDKGVLLSLAGHILLLSITFFLRKKQPLIALSILLFYVSHLIESTIIPLDFMQEHRQYFGSFWLIAALFLSVLWAINSCKKIPNNRPYAIHVVFISFFLAIYFPLLKLLTIWETPETLYQYHATINPHSLRAQLEYFNYLSQQQEIELQNVILQKMEKEFPTHPLVLTAQMNTYCKQHMPIPKATLLQLASALKNYPHYVITLQVVEKFYTLLLDHSCINLSPVEVLYLLQATEQNISIMSRPNMLYMVYLKEAQIFALLGEFRLSYLKIQKGLLIWNSDPLGWIFLANNLLALGEKANAMNTARHIKNMYLNPEVLQEFIKLEAQLKNTP